MDRQIDKHNLADRLTDKKIKIIWPIDGQTDR